MDKYYWYFMKCLTQSQRCERLLRTYIDSTVWKDGIEEIFVPSRSVVVSTSKGRVVKKRSLIGDTIFVKVNQTMFDQNGWVFDLEKLSYLVGKPQLMSDTDVEELQVMVKTHCIDDKPVLEYSYSVGASVSVMSGPFRGKVGIVTSMDEKSVHVEVIVFDRSVDVTISPECLGGV